MSHGKNTIAYSFTMDTFLQRMIHRIHEQAFQRMSPERRARKLSLMKALARSSMRVKNKENEDPFNNNTTKALPQSFSNSTPVKSCQNTDVDDKTEFNRKIIKIFLNEEPEKAEINDGGKPQLVIAKLYDLNSNGESSSAQNSNGDSSREEEFEIDFTSLDSEDVDEENLNMGEDDNQWRSLEIMVDTSEDEFFKSLEESKLFVSTSSLLEEIEADLPTSLSLTKPLDHTFHTLSSYRTMTRLARMDSNVKSPEVVDQRESMKTQYLTSREEYLEMELKIQNCLAKQAEKAIVVSKAQKFLGTAHLESEKALLLANLRFSATQQELQKLKILGGVTVKEDYGQVVISDLFFNVKNSNENNSGLYICTATEKENVQASSLISEIDNGQLHFKEHFTFQNLKKNFVVYIELFKLHYQKDKGVSRTFLLKKLMKKTTFNLNRSLTSSSSGFAYMGCGELRLDHITNRENDKCQIYFIETSLQPMFEPNLTVFLKTDLNIQFKLQGFLSVFQQTWHRRWYVQSGFFLESWLYPEDPECDKVPLESIFLPHYIGEVKAAGLEVCVRPNTFVITLKQSRAEVLFSADSHKEMTRWIDHLNSIMDLIKVWKPNV